MGTDPLAIGDEHVDMSMEAIRVRSKVARELVGADGPDVPWTVRQHFVVDVLAATARAERAETERDELRRAYEKACEALWKHWAAEAGLRRERDKLAATIAAYLGTDERAVHDAANLAHAREERDGLRRQVDAVRALHSPKLGWEAHWKEPAEALSRGWVECAGCELQPAGAGRYLKDCRTLAALDGPTDTEGQNRGE